MNSSIYPRSPREQMAGWVHLPRFIDKIRLHLAGKLAPDYQGNLAKGFDGAWLEAAGVAADRFIEVVRNSITDGEVYDWVIRNVRVPDQTKAAFNAHVLQRGQDTPEMRERLKQRKTESGLAGRDDIQCFVDYIDADEGRLPGV